MTKYSQDYAITFTIKPKWHKLLPEEQLDLASVEIKSKILLTGSKHTTVAEFTKAFNIHFHGIIKMPYCSNTNILKALYNLFRDCKYIGFIYVKPITNFDVWYDYIFKDVAETYKTLNARHPVIQNDYDLDYDLGLAEVSTETKRT